MLLLLMLLWLSPNLVGILALADMGASGDDTHALLYLVDLADTLAGIRRRDKMFRCYLSRMLESTPSSANRFRPLTSLYAHHIFCGLKVWFALYRAGFTATGLAMVL